MPTVLLTFLGRVPKTERGYRQTHYDFGDDPEAAAMRLKDNSHFRTLNSIRNALAHGVRPRNKKITRFTRDAPALLQELRSLLKALQ